MQSHSDKGWPTLMQRDEFNSFVSRVKYLSKEQAAILRAELNSRHFREVGANVTATEADRRASRGVNAARALNASGESRAVACDFGLVEAAVATLDDSGASSHRHDSGNSSSSDSGYSGGGGSSGGGSSGGGGSSSDY